MACSATRATSQVPKRQATLNRHQLDVHTLHGTRRKSPTTSLRVPRPWQGVSRRSESNVRPHARLQSTRTASRVSPKLFPPSLIPGSACHDAAAHALESYHAWHETGRPHGHLSSVAEPPPRPARCPALCVAPESGPRRRASAEWSAAPAGECSQSQPSVIAGNCHGVLMTAA